MAKKKTTKSPQFFETLPAAADPSAAWDNASAWLGAQGQQLWPKLQQAAHAARGYLGAQANYARYSAGWALKHSISKRAIMRYLALMFVGVTASGAALAVIGSQTLASYASNIGHPSTIINNKNTGTTILDRHGKVLYQVYGAANRVTLTEDQTPQLIKDATLAAEDPQFYEHPAFSWKSTARAIYENVTNRAKLQGGSTITQQLVKSSLLTPEKSFTRKYKEILLSVAVEKRYSKGQVLQMYLNQIYYGQGAYGAATASQVYFHKPIDQLSVGEAAMIAGLPLGPTRFDPNFDHQAAVQRRDYVLGQMQANGMITADQAKIAKTEPLVAFKQNITIRAPHFVFYVLGELRKQYGDELVEHGGITVTTSLDLDKQNLAQNIAQAQIARLRGNHVTNTGLVGMDPKNGQILTMLGSVDYNQPDWGNVNVTLSQLQPGSSFKPIAYATAFSKGWSGATTVDDTPVRLPNGDGTIYAPVNYDGKFRGPVTLRQALSNSLNIPAVKVLQYAGVPDTLKMAHTLGITSLNQPERYGLSLVLGGGEVTPLDMATVYSTFASGGIKHQPQSILKVADRNNKDITKPTPAPEQVLDPRLAYMITSILSDNQARSEAFGPNSPLKLSRPAAAKTGTTNDFRDNWTAGYTPSLVTVVWVGNNDHSAMNGVSGITGAAPIWQAYMERALAGTSAENFAQPAGMVVAKVCSRNGGLANPWDTGYDEVFLAELQQTKRCNNPAPKPPEEPKPEPEPAKKEPATNDEETKLPPVTQPNPRPRPQQNP